MGSIRINLHSSGLNLYNILIIIVFIPTDFPDPVVPAIKRCGIFSKSAKTTWPEISFPRARVRWLFRSSNLEPTIKSPNITSSLLRLGISIPKLVLPGCDEILADTDDIALAISSDKPITLLALIPAFGMNSYKVTIGPAL